LLVWFCIRKNRKFFAFSQLFQKDFFNEKKFFSVRSHLVISQNHFSMRTAPFVAVKITKRGDGFLFLHQLPDGFASALMRVHRVCVLHKKQQRKNEMRSIQEKILILRL